MRINQTSGPIAVAGAVHPVELSITHAQLDTELRCELTKLRGDLGFVVTPSLVGIAQMLLLRTPSLTLIPGLNRPCVVVVPTATLLLMGVNQLRVRDRYDHGAVIGHASPRHSDALLTVVRLPTRLSGIVPPVGIHHARVSGLVAVTMPRTALFVNELLSEAPALDLTFVRSPVNYSVMCHG
jgi:hypothetical protein